MRTQTTSELSDNREWAVGDVDPTGWLSAGTTTAQAGRYAAQVGAAQVDDAHVDRAQGDTVDPHSRGRRADGRARSRMNRHLSRRVSGDGFRRSLPATRRRRTAPGRPAPTSVVPAQRLRQDRLLPADARTGYRMGRAARLALTVTVVAAIAVVLTASLTAGSAAPHLVDVTVAPGDSLWSIATRSAPDRDPRAVIDDIRGLNRLSGDVLSAGTVLRVPAAS